MEVLSQEEIDQLLAVMHENELKDLEQTKDIRKIKIYDFKRPDKFSREQIRTTVTIHETFARLSTTSLSIYHRSVVHVHVASVDQLTYEEFIRSVPTPTTLAVINMDPLKGNALLEIDPNITISIIDRVLGGGGDGTRFLHELTDIECNIMEGIIVRLLENFREAWTSVFDLRPRLGQIDTNPQFVQIVPHTDMGVLVTLETKINETEGMINIFYPYITLEPIVGRLSNQFWYSSIKSQTRDLAYEGYVSNNVPVKLTAEILTRTFSYKEITSWKAETLLLPLRPLIPNHCYLKLGDRRVWQCEILPDNKWFQKQIIITGHAERPFGTEDIQMEITQSKGNVMDALLNSGVKVTVELGQTSKTMKEVLTFEEGTFFELDKLAGEPLDIIANGILIGKGETVVIDENFGVRILEIFQSTSDNTEAEPSDSSKETAGDE